jgi:hypothetical protein
MAKRGCVLLAEDAGVLGLRTEVCALDGEADGLKFGALVVCDGFFTELFG